MQGKFFPIILIGMSRYCLLDEVDNQQIIADVLEERDIKINFGSEDSSIEDSFLPKTPAVNLLLEKIDNVIQSINPYLLMVMKHGHI